MNPELGIRRSAVTFDNFDALSAARSFEAMAAYDGFEMTVGRATEGDVVSVMAVSPRFFDVLHGRAVQGRLFTAADFVDEATSIMVSEATWRRRFPKRRIADAPSLRLNGCEYAVIG